MACIGWARLWERQGQDIAQFPHFNRWLDTMLARPAVAAGIAVAAELRTINNMTDPKVQSVLFGQTAR